MLPGFPVGHAVIPTSRDLLRAELIHCHSLRWTVSLQNPQPGVVHQNPSRVTRQRSIHALPIGSEVLLVYNFTANEDDIGRHAGTSLIKSGWNERPQSFWARGLRSPIGVTPPSTSMPRYSLPSVRSLRAWTYASPLNHS